MGEKVGFMDIAGEALATIASVLNDAGLSIVGSLRAPDGFVRLRVKGDALPDECASGEPRLVLGFFASETYGKQLVIRVTRFETVPLRLLDAA